MKVIFMGTPDFAVGTLKALHEAGHEVTLVVSQPDKQKGRKQELAPTPVKAAAEQLGISVESVRAYESCFRTDYSQGDPGDEEVRLHQRTCIPAAQIPRSRADPVGGHQRRKRIRSDHYADG